MGSNEVTEDKTSEELDLDFELLSRNKEGYIDAINNPELNKVIDETRVAKESIFD